MTTLTLAAFVAGLALLVGGADLLVRGASRLATAAGVSPLVIGLTVVAFGTSAPELAASLGASLAGSADLALGNVVGSNIFNVLGILGLAAVVRPQHLAPRVLAVDVPSGLQASSGAVDGAAFQAAATVTFHALKVGHLLGEGPERCGAIDIVDIGLRGGEPELRLCELADAPVPVRLRTAHKCRTPGYGVCWRVCS